MITVVEMNLVFFKVSGKPAVKFMCIKPKGSNLT